MINERSIEIGKNLEIIKSRISEAAEKCGRNVEDIRLMAVSKTKPVEDILAAYEAGQRLFGENRINEAAEKFAQIPEDAEMHMIGHLQSNKAKIAVECAACVESIDKLSTAAELNKKAAALNRNIDILVEINTSKEAQKNGYAGYELFKNDLEPLLELSNLKLRGLMTIAPFTDDEKEVRRSFAELYNCLQRLKSDSGDNTIDVLSMGMSQDFEAAIKEGSTLIRVGTSIFGRRNY